MTIRQFCCRLPQCIIFRLNRTIFRIRCQRLITRLHHLPSPFDGLRVSRRPEKIPTTLRKSLVSLCCRIGLRIASRHVIQRMVRHGGGQRCVWEIEPNLGCRDSLLEGGVLSGRVPIPFRSTPTHPDIPRQYTSLTDHASDTGPATIYTRSRSLSESDIGI